MNPEFSNNTDKKEAIEATAAVPPVVPQTIEQPLAAAEPPPPPLRIVGIGNAGLNLVDLLIRQGFSSRACAVLNSDPSSVAASLADHRFAMDMKVGRGLGSGGDPEKGRVGAEGCQAELSGFLKNARHVVLVCGLGGGAGTGAAPVVARLAKAAGAIVVCAAALPFECEGPLRKRFAETGLADLQKEADLVLPFPNEYSMAPDAAVSLLDTFKTANEFIGSGVRCVCDAFSAGSVMGLPFSNLCMVLRERSEDCVLATAEASGQDRAAVAVEKLIAHPLLARAKLSLSEAEAIGICVLGGPSLGISEVNKIMERASAESGATPFIMGAGIQPSLGDNIAVLLVVCKAREASGIEPRCAPMHAQAPYVGDASGDSERPRARMVPPPPEISQERAQQIHQAQTARARKPSSRMRQGQLALDIISRGRFDKSEPTIHKGEDLDIPTYVRRGIALN